MITTFVFSTLAMDLTYRLQKHTLIIKSLTKPLAFAGQQLKLTPVLAFNHAMAELRDELMSNLTCAWLLEECGENYI